jgi:hypothetical protein
LKFAEVRGKYTDIWWGDLEERQHLGDVGIDGKIILKLIIMGGRAWTFFVWLRMGKNIGLF